MQKISTICFMSLILIVLSGYAQAQPLSEQERIALMDRAMDCFEPKDNNGEIDWQDVCLMYDTPIDDEEKKDEIEQALNRVENRRQIFVVDNKVVIPKIYGEGFEVGMEMSHIKYEEKSLGVTDEGMFYGIRGSYNLRPKQEENVFSSFVDVYHLDGHANYGKVDYEGSGTIKGINDYMIETRFWMGKDFRYGEYSRITPYIGLGQRYLYDDGGGTITSTGFYGYDRRSNYIYAPIGVEGKCEAIPGWQFGFTVEYDALIRGWQDSFLSDVDSGYPDLKNTQTNGYGMRGSLSLIKQTDKFDIVLGPYLRYWHIDDSNTVTATGPVYIVTGLEPENESTELGGQMGVRF